MKKLSKETIDKLIKREQRHYKNNNKPIYKAEYMSFGDDSKAIAIITIKDEDYVYIKYKDYICMKYDDGGYNILGED